MRRALILIISLSLFSFGLGHLWDRCQHHTAQAYLADLNRLRTVIISGDLSAAKQEQAFLHARWQHDMQWLNCLISHHHTRAVNEALLQLATALEMRWPDEALLALDDAFSALSDIQTSHLPTLTNIL